jgi:hypothetical protein
MKPSAPAAGTRRRKPWSNCRPHTCSSRPSPRAPVQGPVGGRGNVLENCDTSDADDCGTQCQSRSSSSGYLVEGGGHAVPAGSPHAPARLQGRENFPDSRLVLRASRYE